MKIIRFCLLLFSLVLIVNGASIQFSNQYIFYGLGEDTVTAYWEISRIKNDLSNKYFGTFDTYTQLWLHHHQFSIYMSEGDSVNSYTYLYRYFLKDEATSDWIQLYPDYLGQAVHISGFWYASWTLNSIPLFNLPVDTGNYCLEFSFSASVRGIEGDTVVSEYFAPDSSPLICYFNVIDSENSNTESSSPINLIFFNARFEKGKVVLEWKTATETENSHFLVYRDDVVIGRVEGNGSCTDPHDYAFVDDQVTPGVHEYAISDVTYGGEAVMHEAVSVEVGSVLAEASFVMNKAYPNPFNPRVALSLDFETSSDAVLNIYNTQGLLVDQLIDGFVNAGSHEIIWDAATMPSGVYIVKMIAGNVVQSQKIVLMK